MGETLAKEHKLTIPLATYRLQFTKDYGFKSAAQSPYLTKLGISHVYASPYLKARPVITHGYDIINHIVASKIRLSIAIIGR